MRLLQLSRFPTTVQMLQKNVLFAKGPSAPLYANFAQIELATVHSGGKSERHIGIDSSVTQDLPECRHFGELWQVSARISRKSFKTGRRSEILVCCAVLYYVLFSQWRAYKWN